MRALAAALLILTAPMSASAQQGPFAQGRISPTLGFGFALSDGALAYYIVGGGVGYYVWDGLEVSFDVEHWIGSEGFTDITKVRPAVRYVLWFLPMFQPYAGVFYRHWFVHDGAPDADTVGTRLGAIFMLGTSLFLDVGAMYEYVLGDYLGDRGAWTFPNFGLGFTF